MLGLIELHKTELRALCRRHHVRRLDVFGSAASGSFDSATSDIDLLVEFAALAPAAYADSFFALKEGLEALLGRKVDLVTPSSVANPHFAARIAAEREPVFAA